MNVIEKRQTETIHGLPVLNFIQARHASLVSITQAVCHETEDHIMKSMAARRNPARACWVPFGIGKYQLHVHRADLR